MTSPEDSSSKPAATRSGTASRVFLDRETGGEVGPMARPVRLKWDNHEWRPATPAPLLRWTNNKEDHTDRSTRCERGTLPPGNRHSRNPHQKNPSPSGVGGGQKVQAILTLGSIISNVCDCFSHRDTWTEDFRYPHIKKVFPVVFWDNPSKKYKCVVE
jgi:hypothetical protein